uniref:Uncharacterized protein n=1 Tax=Mimivirus LCMiAC02 TaxID=2506609 RepID=A0A4D5XEZ5_9VIRU|nr:MAG: hypothetical protein LCMiAC02_03210 [Mimivirus LCMiAC02]
MSSEQPTTTDSTTDSTTGSTTGSTTEPTVTVTSRSDEIGEDEWYVEQRNTLMTAQQARDFSRETNYKVLNTLTTILTEIGIVTMTGQTSLDYSRLTGRETCELYMGELTTLGYTVTMRKTLLRTNYLNISWEQAEEVDEKEDDEEENSDNKE